MESFNSLLKNLKLNNLHISITEDELKYLAKSEKDAKKIIDEKRKLQNKFLNDLFIFDNKCFISNNASISLQYLDDIDRFSITIDKICLMLCFAELFRIDINDVVDQNSEVTCLNLKKQFKLKRKQIQDMVDKMDFNGCESVFPIPEIAKKVKGIEKQRILYNISCAYIQCITTFIRDSKVLMTKDDLDITDYVGDYIDPDKLGLWIAIRLMNDFGNTNNEEYKKHYVSTIDEVTSDEENIKLNYLVDFYNYIMNDKRYLKGFDKQIYTPHYNNDFYKVSDFIRDYKEIYSNYLFSGKKLDNKLVKKMTKNPPKNIMVGWEILPEGHIDIPKKTYDKKNMKTIGKLSVDKNELNLKRQNLAHEKKEFWESTNPIMIIRGMNYLSGYYGFVYPNGKILLDKIYKDEKCFIPVEESIYCMNVKNFMDLSRSSKTEIINKIVSKEVDAKRIYHSKNWKDRVIKEINSDTSITSGDFNDLCEKLGQDKLLIKD